MQIGKEKVNVTFVVGKNLVHDVIIGVDILKPYLFIVGFSSDTFKYRNESIKITTRCSTRSKLVSSATRIQIEPFSSIVYEYRLEGDQWPEHVLIERAGRADVVECVACVSENKVKLVIQNNTCFRKTLNQHALLCRI